MSDDEKTWAGVTERDVTRSLLEWERALYQASGNPLSAWGALRLARRHGEPVPEWVLAYLDEVADGLHRITIDHIGPARPESANVVREIAAALRLHEPGRGKRSRFHQAADDMWMILGQEVQDRINEGAQQVYATEEVAKLNGTSVSTVRRAFLRHRNLRASL